MKSDGLLVAFAEILSRVFRDIEPCVSFFFFSRVLKRIILYNNELGDEGEKAICDAVSEREGFELMM